MVTLCQETYYVKRHDLGIFDYITHRDIYITTVFLLKMEVVSFRNFHVSFFMYFRVVLFAVELEAKEIE